MKLFSTLLVTITLLSISGCAKYKARQLPRLKPYVTAHKETSVAFAAKAFTVTESKTYLGKDVLKHGYQPVHITLINKTDHYLQFSPDLISIPTVPAEIVAKTVYDSTASRAVGWGIAGLFIPIFLIPAIVDSAWSCEANHKLDIDYGLKATAKKLIEPHGELTGIIFVPEADYNEPFTITLVDEETGKKIVSTSQIIDQE